jgi:glycine dehydrogenase
VLTPEFFDTITVRYRGLLVAAALGAPINLRLVDDDTLGITLDETTSAETVDGVACSGPPANPARRPAPDPRCAAGELPLHPVFHEYRSETQMPVLSAGSPTSTSFRRTMIPLGRAR